MIETGDTDDETESQWTAVEMAVSEKDSKSTHLSVYLQHDLSSL